MIFDKPTEFDEAATLMRRKGLLPAGLPSQELSKLGRDVRRMSVFSAKVRNARFLSQVQESVTAMLASDSRHDAGSARLALRALVEATDPPALLTDARLNLILEMNAALAAGYGQWKQGQNSDILDLWPAQELYRLGERREPRDWPARWREAGGKFFGGRMVALKNDPIWEAISAFGEPFPPFDFNSGMDVRDVDFEEAVSLGLLARNERVIPEDRPFAADAAATLEGMEPEMRAALLSSLGDGFTAKGNTVEAANEGGQPCGRGFISADKVCRIGGAAPESSLKPSRERAFNGRPVKLKTKLSKLETGAIGEKVVIDYLRAQGYADARTYDTTRTNAPVDLLQDHELIEVKTGLASNGESAQQWRATIGQPGKEEAAMLKKMSSEEKRVWNAAKAAKILERKNDELRRYTKATGRKAEGKTIATIVNPDTRTVDIFEFKGFHLRIPWNSAEAKAGYRGSFKY